MSTAAYFPLALALSAALCACLISARRSACRAGSAWPVSANSCAFGFSLLSDSHLAIIQRFLLQVCQPRFLQNSICSGNSRKTPFAPNSDSTPNLPRFPPCVWCTTEWHQTNTKWKSCSLVWMTQKRAMSNFCLFSARCLRDNVATSMPIASLFS